MVNNFILAAGPSGRECLVAAASRLRNEQKNVTCIFHHDLQIPGVKTVFNLSELLNNTQDGSKNLVVAMTPEAAPPLRHFIGQERNYRMLGAENLAYQVATSASLAFSFLQKAGAKITEEWSENDLEFVFFVSGRHVLGYARSKEESAIPVAFHTKPIVEKHYRGSIVIPVTGQKISQLAEYVRLTCITADYSGPVQVRVNVQDDAFLVNGVTFSWNLHRGFMPAFLSLLNQPFSSFLYSMQKNNYFNPQIKSESAISLTVNHPTLHTWVTQEGSTHPTYIPDENWEKCPETEDKLDGFSSLSYTLQRLKDLRIRLHCGSKPEQPDETTPVLDEQSPVPENCEEVII